MSEELESFEFVVGSDSTRLPLRLRRYPLPRPGAPAVVLTHGGNTRSDIYTVPAGGLGGFLHRCGLDVWLLDWRASPFVCDPLLEKWPPLGGSVAAERAAYTMDTVVEEDFRVALEVVRRHVPDAPLSMVSFCVSAGALSIAIARGAIEEFRVNNVVLLTLGLFYEVIWNSWLKAEDYLLERVIHNDPRCRGVNPNTPEKWPQDMASAYARWPAAWLPPRGSKNDEMLARLTFMVGRPYRTERLHPSLRNVALDHYFGNLHMGLYLHTGQMVRRGYAARFDEPDVTDRRPRGAAAHASVRPLRDVARSRGERVPGDLSPEFFRNKSVTLVSAAVDEVWHRDSIDLMYTWLRANDCVGASKVVLPGYNIMELLWGERAHVDLFPVIAERVGKPPGISSIPAPPRRSGPPEAPRSPLGGEAQND